MYEYLAILNDLSNVNKRIKLNYIGYDVLNVWN